MINTQVQSEIAKFRDSKETFNIIDENGIGHSEVMILGIQFNEKSDDIVKIIDMGEFKEDFYVYDYEITLSDLIKARQNYLDNK